MSLYPTVTLVEAHAVRVRGRILDAGKLREITGTARYAGKPGWIEIYTLHLGRRKIVRLKDHDLAAVTEPYARERP